MIERLQQAHATLQQLPLLNSKLQAGHNVLPQIEQADVRLQSLIGDILFHLRSSLIIELEPTCESTQRASVQRIGRYRALSIVGALSTKGPIDMLCMRFEPPFGSAFLSCVDAFELKVYDGISN